MLRTTKTSLLSVVLLHIAGVTPLLAQPLLTGAVLGAANEPLPGAQVELAPVLSNHETGRLRLEGRDLPPPQATARSDANGRFALEAPQAGVWKVVVRAAGRVPMQYGPLLLLETEELPPVQLPPDAGSRLRVTTEHGQAVAGAWIFASPTSEITPRGRPAGGWRPEFRMGRTAADGSLTLPRLDGERLQVSVFASGRSEEVQPSFQEGTIQLRPRRETTVSLQVVAPDATPVAGVLVRVGDHAWPIGLTAADGTVALPVREGEAVKPRLVAPDGRQQVASLSARPNGGRQTLTLPPAVRVTGKVLDAASGRGLADAVLWLDIDPAIALRTDREGNYTLAAPVKGRVSLAARAVGYLPKRLAISSSDIASRRAPTVALDRAARIRGSVVGPEGKPLVGASVEAVNTESLGPRTFSPSDPVTDRAATDSGGGFELRQLRAGEEYELRVTKPGYFPTAHVAVASAAGGKAAPLQVQLQTACAVHGWIRDPQGQPVTAARILLRPARRPGWEGQTREAQDSDGSDPTAMAVDSGQAGRFAIQESPAAEVDLEVRKAGYAPAQRRGVRVSSPCSSSFDLGTVVLKPGVRLAGRVVNRRGRAISGAEVFLLDRLPPRRIWEQALQRRKPDTTTGPDGSFAVEDLPRGVPHHLLVAADGYLATAVRGVRPPPRGPLLVRMDSAAVLRGRVVDEAGEAVSGARIDLTWQEVLPNDPHERPVGEPILRSALSNAEGRFEIAEAPMGKLSLAVTAQGFIPIESFEAVVPAADPAQELTLILRRGARLEGRVTTAAGEPVPGVRISAGGNAGHSDVEGAYAVDGIPPGRQEIDVFHPHYRRRIQPLLIEEGTNRFDVELEEGFKVTGRVVDQDGKPVIAAQVELTTLNRAELRVHRTRTGEDGGFLLHPVASGRYRLGASASGLAAAELAEPVVVSGRSVNGLEIVLRQGATVSGRVLGLSAEELTAVAVTAHGETGEARPARTDSDGRYEVRDLSPGDWLLRASLWQGQRQVEERVPIAPSDRQLLRDLKFDRRVTLSGRVLFEDEPLAASTVSVRGERFSIERSVTSGFDGGFVLQDLEPDRYWLGVRSAQRLLVHNEALDLNEDLEVTIRLEAATIAGRVEEDGSGKPISGALLALRPTAGPDFVITDTSKPDGSFRVIHVPPGSYRLAVQASGYAPAEREIALTGGEELADLKLGLTPTSGLQIQVRLASGQVPDLVHVLARNQDGAPILAGSYRPKASGSTELSSLPAGTWQLFVSAPGGAMVSQSVTVPGEPLAITLPNAGRLQVRIPQLASQNLLATLSLLRQDQKPFWILGLGGSVQQSWTLRGGKGTVDGIPAGQWLLVAEAPDGRVWHGSVVTPGTGEVAISLD